MSERNPTSLMASDCGNRGGQAVLERVGVLRNALLHHWMTTVVGVVFNLLLDVGHHGWSLTKVVTILILIGILIVTILVENGIDSFEFAGEYDREAFSTNGFFDSGNAGAITPFVEFAS